MVVQFRHPIKHQCGAPKCSFLVFLFYTTTHDEFTNFDASNGHFLWPHMFRWRNCTHPGEIVPLYRSCKIGWYQCAKCHVVHISNWEGAQIDYLSPKLVIGGENQVWKKASRISEKLAKLDHLMFIYTLLTNCPCMTWCIPGSNSQMTWKLPTIIINLKFILYLLAE